MNILVVYESITGNTAFGVEIVRSVLRCGTIARYCATAFR